MAVMKRKAQELYDHGHELFDCTTEAPSYEVLREATVDPQE